MDRLQLQTRPPFVRLFSRQIPADPSQQVRACQLPPEPHGSPLSAVSALLGVPAAAPTRALTLKPPGSHLQGRHTVPVRRCVVFYSSSHQCRAALADMWVYGDCLLNAFGPCAILLQGVRIFSAPLPFNPAKSEALSAHAAPAATAPAAPLSAAEAEAERGRAQAPSLFELAASAVDWHAADAPECLEAAAGNTSPSASLAPGTLAAVPRLNARASWLAHGAIFGDAVMLRVRLAIRSSLLT